MRSRDLIYQTTEKVGKPVFLQGWAHSVRRHGGVVFIDLRDRSGIVQLVGDKSVPKVSPEDVVSVEGIVRKRPEHMIHPNLPTGEVEVEIKTLTILSHAKELPLPIHTDGYNISEEVRLKYRYLDLRRERLQRNIRLRSRFVDAVRQYLFRHDFVEIETPMLTKSTPEGSRDFLVPSRLHPGTFYALPQSPQQYKQLLMVAGFERYFQIARCLRDEDLRADRGFEHTQIDLEMSFVTREDVMAMDEGMITHVIESLGYTIKQKPFPIFTYQEAMKKFGADKFDLRTEEEKKQGILAFAWVIDFPFFEKTKEGGWTFTHNPFSMPKEEHKAWLLNKERIGEILTSQYDLVCNGYEVGGGSIRSHEPEVLQAVFEVMGYDKDRIYKQFGHMLEAFSYGVPPHGGLAHGIERLLMTITGEPYLREVVAFPQTSGGMTSVMDAPNEVDQEQLDELGIAIVKKTASVFEQIVDELKKHAVSFTVSDHEPVKTSEEAAKVRGVPVSTGAKAILMYADGKPIMVVVPGDKKIDIKRFKSLYGIRDLRMATPDEVKRVTGVEIGAVPPFGHIFSIPLYMDHHVKDNERIYFNPGRHDKTIAMNSHDLERVARPMLGDFSR